MNALLGEMAAMFGLGVASIWTNPCVLPLYPGFLAYLSSQPQGERRANPIWLGFLVFLGVVTMMLALGALIAGLALAVGSALVWLTPLAYGTIILLGVLLLLGRNPFARMAQIQVPAVRNPYANAFVYGLLFGPIALPCSGAQLSLVFTLSLTAADTLRNVGLFFIFGLGFGLPLFLLAFLGRAQQQRLVRLFAQHYRAVNLVAGVLLVTVGVYGLWKEWDSIVLFWQYRNL
jgi:cytochrome c-type biogenesis protein